MYRAHITSDFFLADHKVKPGIVLVEDVTAASIITLRCGTIEPVMAMHDHLPIEHCKSVLLIRPGGYGDLLFLTPIIADLVGRGIHVTVCTHPRYFSILEWQPCFVAPYPMLETEIHAFDRVAWMQDAVEDSKDSTHIVDLFAARVGITLDEDKKVCRYIVREDEKQWAAERFPRTAKPRIAIQAKASADCRSYPDRPMMGVASMLIERGYEVALFGAPCTIQANPVFLNLTAHGLDIRQSAAVLEQCDVCVAPDSAICHLAGALNVPTVALYGPFPHRARTRYHPSVFAISGQAPCAPCFHHARVEAWPEGKPCATAHFCVALGQIHPDRIVAKVVQLLNR